MKARVYLRRFSKYLAEILKIDMPKVTFSKNKLDGSLSGGALNDGAEVRVYTQMDLNAEVDTSSEDFIDLLLRLCHEMRHAWQVQNAPELINGYRPRQELDLVEYNRQPAELDAHAFAALIIEANFGLSPRFMSLDNETKMLISARKRDIYEEMRRTV